MLGQGGSNPQTAPILHVIEPLHLQSPTRCAAENASHLLKLLASPSLPDVISIKGFLFLGANSRMSDAKSIVSSCFQGKQSRFASSLFQHFMGHVYPILRLLELAAL